MPINKPQITVAAALSKPIPVIASEARQSMPPAPSPVSQVYNVVVGDRIALNELYAQLHRNLLPLYPHLQDTQSVYRDFRAGDVRHSLADISKADRLLGYASTQRVGERLSLAMPWYVSHFQPKTEKETS